MTEQAPQSTEPSQPEQYTLRTRSTRHVLATAPSDTGITAVTWGPASEEPAIAPPLPSIPSFSTLEDALPQEFSVIGTRHVRVADLLVHHADGTAASLVRLDGAPELSRGDDGDVLRATLLEDVGDLRMDLTWRTSPHHDVITREAVLTNIGDAPLTLVRARTGSFGVHLPGGADVTTLTGEWCEEFGPTTTRLRCGTFSLSSRQGITSHRDSPVLTLADPTDPARGCWSVQLAWSGSWQAEVDMTDTGGWARIAAGACDLENQVTLRPGERYEAPALLGLWAPDSDAAARAWHCFARLDLLRDTSAERRPITYNSWYSTYFDVRADQQIELARHAADLGCEMFVLDDGWFRGRDSDHAALGDWEPDARTFSDGLAPLVAAAHPCLLPGAGRPAPRVPADHDRGLLRRRRSDRRRGPGPLRRGLDQ